MDSNSTNVSKDLYNLILDRKANPVDGSYTNYLFDKGIEKSGKMVGEEAIEAIISASRAGNDGADGHYTRRSGRGIEEALKPVPNSSCAVEL